jgi:endo-1,4-beta-xylanase
VVSIVDTEPPDASLTLTPDVLWPPNHKLTTIVATLTVSDGCDPHPSVTLVSITSNEPDEGTGDGNQPNDIQDADFGTDDRVFRLRAERSGNGSGRVYTVTYRVEDGHGNSTEVSGEVRVPHSK